MTAIDPFNHGSTETLNSHVIEAEQQRAALGVMRRFAGTPDMRDMLAALDLSRTADDMLLRRRQDLGQLVCTPEPPKLALVPSASRSGPAEGVLTTLTDPKGRRLRPQQRDAIARAHRALAEEVTEEVPPIDGRPRCGRRLHYRTKTNTKRRVDGGKQCLDCQAVNSARSILRNYGLLT
jgi:hypothetical protein